MIKFQISLIWEGKTTYEHTVPKHLEHLRLPGFMCLYVHGPWGYILSQWIAGPFFVYGIHHFDINIANTVFPVVPRQTFCLQKLITGFIRAQINKGLPVQLSDKWSQFFALPAKIRQEAFLPVGFATAAHFDFSLDFLQSKIAHYPELKDVIEQALLHPDQAYEASTVVHTEFFKRSGSSCPNG